MSLQNLAQSMALHGRNGDSMLVHMTPNEVQSLQENLQAHGRTLTVNPHTGLPEAWIGNDLVDSARDFAADVTSSPLGALALGAALGPAGYGLSAAMAGLTVGGISALASGNLGQGLMSGLSAYGGAGIGGTLMDLGAASPTISPEATSVNAVNGADLASDAASGTAPTTAETLKAGAQSAANDPKAALAALGDGSTTKGAATLAAAGMPLMMSGQPTVPTVTKAPDDSMIRPYTFNRQALTPPDMVRASYHPGQSSRERKWFDDSYTALTPYKAPGPEYAAGGAIENMSNANSTGANTGYPTANITQGGYATPWQTPISRNVVTGPSDANVDQMTGELRFAAGGLGSLGGYSDGGRMLKGPGDGMSDSIPAKIAGQQPARLANEEFVVPADVVSGLGNGSSESGAKQLYKMMDRVRMARTGTKKQGKQINPAKLLPA